MRVLKEFKSEARINTVLSVPVRKKVKGFQRRGDDALRLSPEALIKTYTLDS